MSEAVPAPAPASRRTPARVTKAIDTTTDAARDLAGRTAARIESSPLAVLAGGVALGVLAGAFVPRSARETTLLAPVGRRLSDTAHGALDAARDTAKSELDMLGLTRDAARDQLGKLVGDVLKALATAGTAAFAAAKAPPPQPDAKKAGSAR